MKSKGKELSQKERKEVDVWKYWKEKKKKKSEKKVIKDKENFSNTAYKRWRTSSTSPSKVGHKS